MMRPLLLLVAGSPSLVAAFVDQTTTEDLFESGGSCTGNPVASHSSKDGVCEPVSAAYASTWTLSQYSFSGSALRTDNNVAWCWATTKAECESGLLSAYSSSGPIGVGNGGDTALYIAAGTRHRRRLPASASVTATPSQRTATAAPTIGA